MAVFVELFDLDVGVALGADDGEVVGAAGVGESSVELETLR